MIDLPICKTEEIFSNENEDRIANENGRFTCKHCNQTFSKLIYAMRYENKSCNKKSNQTTNKSMKEFWFVYGPDWESNRLWKIYQ